MKNILFITCLFVPCGFALDIELEQKKIEEHRQIMKDKMCVIEREDRKFYHQNQVLNLKRSLVTNDLDSQMIEEIKKNIQLHQEKVIEFSKSENCISSKDD